MVVSQFGSSLRLNSLLYLHPNKRTNRPLEKRAFIHRLSAERSQNYAPNLPIKLMSFPVVLTHTGVRMNKSHLKLNFVLLFRVYCRCSALCI